MMRLMDMTSIAFPRLGYSFAELEVLTGLSRATIYRMHKRGEFRTVRRGRRQLVPADEVLRLCGTAAEAAA